MAYLKSVCKSLKISTVRMCNSKIKWIILVIITALFRYNITYSDFITILVWF